MSGMFRRRILTLYVFLGISMFCCWNLRSLHGSVNGKCNVLIVSYMRSGSTFTADLLQQAPDVLYAYEPLKHFATTGRFESEFVCDIRSGLCRKPLSIKEEPEFILNSTLDFYNCRLNKLPKEFVHDYGKSIAFAKHKACLQQTRNNTSCTNDLMKTCKTSTKIIKSLRISMALTARMMKYNPSLKVVYLIRDPRAMFLSQIKANLLNILKPNSVQQLVTYCQIILEDLEFFKSLKKSFPNRIRVYRYEFLMENILESVKDLYSFLGLRLTGSVYRWVDSHTSGALPRDGIFGTVRNSSNTVSAWRRNSNPLFIDTIDSYCQDVYDLAGYNLLKSLTEIRDLRLPSWKKTFKLETE